MLSLARKRIVVNKIKFSRKRPLLPLTSFSCRFSKTTAHTSMIDDGGVAALLRHCLRAPVKRISSCPNRNSLTDTHYFFARTVFLCAISNHVFSVTAVVSIVTLLSQNTSPSHSLAAFYHLFRHDDVRRTFSCPPTDILSHASLA